MLWTTADPESHKLLRQLGPEPLSQEFTGAYLFNKTRGRKRRVRDVLLDSHVVAGIGNIYANEALYLAGIDPRRAAGRISRPRMDRLVAAIVEVLSAAIRAGGTTLRDFRGGDGRPGYFQLVLAEYARVDGAVRASPRLFPAGPVGIRTHRRTLPRVRVTHHKCTTWRALTFLLSSLPEVNSCNYIGL